MKQDLIDLIPTKVLRDTSTNNNYPKTLLIRNEVGGMVWQLYHVPSLESAILLAYTSRTQGYEDQELVDYKPESEENYPEWDTSPEYSAYLEKNMPIINQIKALHYD